MIRSVSVGPEVGYLAVLLCALLEKFWENGFLNALQLVCFYHLVQVKMNHHSIWRAFLLEFLLLQTPWYWCWNLLLMMGHSEIFFIILYSCWHAYFERKCMSLMWKILTNQTHYVYSSLWPTSEQSLLIYIQDTSHVLHVQSSSYKKTILTYYIWPDSPLIHLSSSP